MTYPIKFLLLQKSELMYEVAIRGELPSDNVEGLRRQVTKLTQLYASEDVCESVFEFSVDLKGSNDTLEKVRQNLESLKIAAPNDSLFNRTKSLLHHLYFRLSRIVRPTRLDDATLLDKVQESFQRNLNRLSTCAPNLNASASAAAYTTSVAEGPSTTSSINMSVTCDRGITAELSKLKYDGKSCIRAFIQKLEEFRLAKSFSEQKMLLSATDLFTGDALHWYRATKSKITGWESLITALYADFDLVDYDYRMISEIRSRSQGVGENVVVYFAIMEGMFCRLIKPMCEEDKMEILLHNIRPCFATMIAASNVKSVDELKQTCRNFEKVKSRSDNFKEPPSVGSDTLAPEFGFTEVRKETRRNLNTFQSNRNPSFQQANNSSQDSRNPSFQQADSSFQPARYFQPPLRNPRTPGPGVAPISQVYCYRCRVSTHSMRDCQAERTIFCFRCGKKDVRRPDCPNCSAPAAKN